MVRSRPAPRRPPAGGGRARPAARAGPAALEVLQADLRRLREVEAPPGAAARLPEGVVAVDFLRARLGEESISWRLEGGRILRNAGGRDRALGRNVEGFRVERRGRLFTVRLRGAARLDGLVPAWSASASAAVRLEGER